MEITSWMGMRLVILGMIVLETVLVHQDFFQIKTHTIQDVTKVLIFDFSPFYQLPSYNLHKKDCSSNCIICDTSDGTCQQCKNSFKALGPNCIQCGSGHWSNGIFCSGISILQYSLFPLNVKSFCKYLK